MCESKVKEILKRYSFRELSKINDFLILEIDDDNLEETINFVKSNDKEKQKNFDDILYSGDKYIGFFLEGNQYLIGSTENKGIIIDFIGEADTRLMLPIKDFIFMISHKKQVLNDIDAIRD
ncbi:hypothetical protein SAMN04488168_11060 [Bacillus sp. 491mf]|uniref:hypothetical protein n=1 Tax=unclassified Bacillus (in: firmicutes) TaxID=185979 RepID=UPI00054E9041|nr:MULTISPECIES: hypothetical protein [unclassified Bacillus (in: firmicutes)]SFC83017.1 hypothetical protein SAMN04488168_11060 [Bacillus sp. 491mf]